MDSVVEVRGLHRSFGELVAVDNLDFDVQLGQFLGFLGPNGAGKSTTIKMLTGLLRPDSGTIRILGHDLSADSVEVKRQIGVVPEGLALFDRLSGNQFLNFAGRMYGLDRDTAAQRSAELLEYMELADSADKMVADYSHGMKKKIALSAAMIHRPQILFLDEPFEGVDAIAARTLKKMLQKFIERGGTIFLTSHVLEVVERLCSHIAIIDHGKMVIYGEIEELRRGVSLQGGDAPGPQLTLEQIFVKVVGGKEQEREISWL